MAKCPPCRKAKITGKPGHDYCTGAAYRKHGCRCACTGLPPPPRVGLKAKRAQVLVAA